MTAGRCALSQVIESELLEKARNGDVNAFERVIAPYLPSLLAYARAICGDHHTAEDIVQEVALVASRNLQSLYREAEFFNWLKGIARRKALSARRDGEKLRPVLGQIIEEASEHPELDAEEDELRALSECLQELNERSRIVVQTHYFEGASIETMAERFGLNGNTIKTILFRARKALEGCVQQRIAQGDRVP